ncbi:MAG: S8/S53 family peptidase [Thermoleophilia bacterium]|nr:S8/S53 family peptidase [Thermoleophilia bacterium]
MTTGDEGRPGVDLEAHPGFGDVLAVGRGPGTLHYARPDQILIRREDLDRAVRLVRRTGDRVAIDEKEAGATGVVLVRVRGLGAPHGLVAALRRAGVRAHLNHVIAGQPKYQGFPLGQPEPAEPGDLGATGEGPAVAVVDTHVVDGSWLLAKGHVRTASPAAGADDEALLGLLDDQAGHGEFVAGVVLRVAPGARVTLAGALDNRGICDDLGLAAALEAVAGWDPCPAVLNLSLGAYTAGDEVLPATSAVLDRLMASGVLVVAAGGNDGIARPLWPAALPGVVGVGAVEGTSRVPAAWSNHGDSVDVWAPGTGIRSAFVAFANTAPGHPATAWRGWARGDGTSFAAPAVAGAVARRMSEDGTLDAHAALADLLSGAADVDGRPLIDPGADLS